MLVTRWRQEKVGHLNARIPVRELTAAEQDQLPLKPVRAILLPVIYLIVPEVDVFVVGEDQTLFDGRPRCLFTQSTLSLAAVVFSLGDV